MQLQRALLLLASFALCVLGAELFLRFARPAELRGLHQVRPDAAWLYGLAPGTRSRSAGGVDYEINRDGFRDRRHAQPKPAERSRIIVIGDSITFGYGVASEARFTKVLEQRLEVAALPGEPTVDVLNFGVNGYNPYNEAAQLADLAPAYEPDLVLVQFCINDLNDPTLHFGASAQLTLGSLPEAAFPDPAKRRERSAVEEACRRSQLCERILGLSLGGVAAPWDALERGTAYRPNVGPSYQTEWKWLEHRYAEMAETAARMNARFGVIAVPFRDELDSQQEQQSRVEVALLSLGKVGGWSTLPLHASFVDARRRNPEEHLFVDLWHPSARGHAVIAAALDRELRCQGLVPRAQRDDCHDAD